MWIILSKLWKKVNISATSYLNIVVKLLLKIKNQSNFEHLNLKIRPPIKNIQAITITPYLELLVIWVVIPINNVPINEAPLPKISKILKYSLAWLSGIILA